MAPHDHVNMLNSMATTLNQVRSMINHTAEMWEDLIYEELRNNEERQITNVDITPVETTTHIVA
jgi:hypothetical protein